VPDFPSFVSMLEEWLGGPFPSPQPESRLREDLSLDSLAMIEVLVFLEHHGIRLPDDLIPELTTLADLHHYFTVLAPRVEGDGDTGGPARAVGT